MRKNNTQTNGSKDTTPATAVGVGNKPQRFAFLEKLWRAEGE